MRPGGVTRAIERVSLAGIGAITTRRICAPSPETLRHTGRRIETLEAIGSLPNNLRKNERVPTQCRLADWLARVKRNVRRVHDDVLICLLPGVLARVENGRIVLPYDAIYGDFMLHAEAS